MLRRWREHPAAALTALLSLATLVGSTFLLTQVASFTVSDSPVKHPPMPSHHSDSRPLTHTEAASRYISRAIDRLEAKANAVSREANVTADALKEVKAVILANPTQAISYTLLKQEVAENQKSTGAAIAAVEGSVNKEYDLMKWVIGVLVLGILGMLVSIALPAMRANKPSGI
jgi:hypothetical protein